MKAKYFTLFTGLLIMITSCNTPETKLQNDNPDIMVLFLHHSTGNNIWYGDVKPSKRLHFGKNLGMVPRLIEEYNNNQETKICIEERTFPRGNPYPWENYPYDYYNIWVKNAGEKPFMKEPTLEILTKDYDIIIFKHCYPVSSILTDEKNPDINSKNKTLANYKLQYNALKEKIYEFPQTKFIVWTGAALVENITTPDEAKRAQEFTKWVKDEWDEPDDNINIFDFRNIETEGGLYLKPEYAISQSNSHPNKILATKAANQFTEMIFGIIEASNK